MSAWDFENLVGGGRTTPNRRRFAILSRVLATGGQDTFPIRSVGPHVRSWLGQSQIPVHIVNYEDLVAEPDRELKSILEFLGAQIGRAEPMRSSAVR